jgi:hypothetical protein
MTYKKSQFITQVEDLGEIIELIARFPKILRVSAELIEATIREHAHPDCIACANLLGAIGQALALAAEEVR